MSDGKQCIFIKPDGMQCEAYSLSDSDLCWAHEPKLEEKRQLAKSLGGRIPERIAGIPTELVSVNDILGLIAEVVGNLRALPISISQSKALINAASAAMECIQLSEMEQRMRNLEDLYNGGKNENH
jgi:hypothetical protein